MKYCSGCEHFDYEVDMVEPWAYSCGACYCLRCHFDERNPSKDITVDASKCSDFEQREKRSSTFV